MNYQLSRVYKVLFLSLITLLLISCSGGGPVITPGPDIALLVSGDDGSYEDRVVLVWQTDESYDSYRIYRDDVLIDEVDLPPYEDFTALYCVRYTYSIAGVSIMGEEGPKSAAQLGFRGSLPGKPVDLKASDGSYTDQIALSWTAVENADYYIVYRDSEILNDFVTETTFTDDTAALETFYTYSVIAVNGCGESEISDSDTGFYSTQIISPPQWYMYPGIQWIETSGDCAMIGFDFAMDPNNGNDPITYNLYYVDRTDTGNNNPFQSPNTKVEDISSGYEVCGLTPGHEYCFGVRAQNIWGMEEENEITICQTMPE